MALHLIPIFRTKASRGPVGLVIVKRIVVGFDEEKREKEKKELDHCGGTRHFYS